MALAFEPVGRYFADDHPLNDTDPSGGDIDGASTITDRAEGFVPTTPIPGSGDGDLDWYYKEFHRVDNGSAEDMPAPAWYVKSGLKKPTVTGTFSIVGLVAGQTGKVKLSFVNDATGNWDSEVLTMTGVTPVVSTKQGRLNEHVFAERVNAGEDAWEAVTNDVLISRGTLLGKIPLIQATGYSAADSLHQIALEKLVNDGTPGNGDHGVANRLYDVSADSEVESFTEAFDPASAVQLPGAIDVADTEAVGIWWWVHRDEEQTEPVDKLEPVLAIRVTV